MATHYDVLGVPHDATPDVIRQAYRRLAREHHPDRRGTAVDPGAAMARLNEAWTVLSDPDSRARYDTLVVPTLPSDVSQPPSRPVTRKDQWYAGVREQIRRLGHEAARSSSQALSLKRKGLPRSRYEATIPGILRHLQEDTEARLRHARSLGVAPLDLGLTSALIGVRSYATLLGRAAMVGEPVPDLMTTAEMLDRMWDTLAHGLRHEIVSELGGNPHLARWLRSRGAPEA
ncbi:MAG: J domain-containing protein [Actinomycetota bacterium]